tara:strand:- start:2934 stop:3806 length:873 start_codon:yes stop_codon:yes gene_type:complete
MKSDEIKKKEKILVAGPWVGEFGWELFAWQAYVRALSEYYDKTICISSPHSKFLYEDFCDQFIGFVPDKGGYRDSYYKVGFSVTNKLMADFLRKASISASEQEISIMAPRRIGDPPRTHFSEEFQFGAHRISPIYKKFGSHSVEYKNTVVIHARCRTLRTGDNWPRKKWDIFVDKLINTGYNIVSIGTEEESMHIARTVNKRECDQQELLNMLASCKGIAGPSSGAIHLASLCGCPQTVWTTDYNLDRYTKNWNPFSAEVLFLSEYGWQPSPEYVFDKFMENLNNKEDKT